MASNIDDTYLDEYHVPRIDEIRFGFASAPSEWVGDYDYASELDVSDLVSRNNVAGAAKTKTTKRDSSFISDDDGNGIGNFCLFLKHFEMIDTATAEGRIDSKKAERLRKCLNSDDIISSLLSEQIPKLRRGKGYKCRVCQVPVKGHLCPYCPVCSTPVNKVKKNDEHMHVNCIKCFEEGKKRKKLVQILRGECDCSS
jgi:hypothetical protein